MTKIVYVGEDSSISTPAQNRSLIDILSMFEDDCEAHFGDVDDNNQIFHQIVSALGRFYIVAHPSTGRTPNGTPVKYMPYVLQHVWPEQKTYDRDRELISLAKILIACPSELENKTKSESRAWRMIRFARVNSVSHFVILPEGQIRFKMY